LKNEPHITRNIIYNRTSLKYWIKMEHYIGVFLIAVMLRLQWTCDSSFYYS
jgi:hypothetical protein